MDYASAETRAVGEKTIEAHLAEIPSAPIRRQTAKELKAIENGKRDIYY